jgi:hypothetical protein
MVHIAAIKIARMMVVNLAVQAVDAQILFKKFVMEAVLINAHYI